MPRMDGIEVSRRIVAKDPQARILVLTITAADDKVFPAIKAGAFGYLLKDSEAAGVGARHPSGLSRQIVAFPGHRPQGASGDIPSSSSTVDAGASHGARGGSPTYRHPGEEQPGDRQGVGDQRGHGAHAREQHPEQVAPGQPHPGCPLCPAGGHRRVGGAVILSNVHPKLQSAGSML